MIFELIPFVCRRSVPLVLFKSLPIQLLPFISPSIQENLLVSTYAKLFAISNILFANHFLESVDGLFLSESLNLLHVVLVYALIHCHDSLLHLELLNVSLNVIDADFLVVDDTLFLVVVVAKVTRVEHVVLQ